MLLTEAAVHGAMAGFVRPRGPCWRLAAGDLHAPARNEPVRLRPRPLLSSRQGTGYSISATAATDGVNKALIVKWGYE